jgi:hypothetical protein
MRTSPPSPLHVLVGRRSAANGSAARGKAIAVFSSAAKNCPRKRSLRLVAEGGEVEKTHTRTVLIQEYA